MKVIYTLICPKTKKIKYIGCSHNPIRMYHFFMYDKRDNPVCDWFRSLGDDKDLISLEVVDVVNSRSRVIVNKRIKQWIDYYQDKGLLDLIPSKNPRRKHLIRLFLNDDEFNQLNELAVKMNMSIPKYLRNVINFSRTVKTLNRIKKA